MALLGLIEHELVLVLLEELAAPLLVQEQGVDLLDVLHNDLRPLPLLAGQARHGDELDGVPQTRLAPDLGEDGERVIRDLRVLLLAPNPEDLLEVLLLVLGGRDDDGPVQQV